MAVAPRPAIPVKPVAVIGAATVAAWVALSRSTTMPARPVAFLAWWVVMMTAMMLP
jgi:hypothetical protein